MKIRKFRAGDMVESASDSEEDKAKTAGLAASNAEKKSSGFLGLGRLFQGNIDEKGSEAYNKYGAGYGREVEAENDRLKAETRKATAAPAPAPAASAPAPVRIHKTAGAAAPAAASAARAAAMAREAADRADKNDTADMKRNQSNAAGPSTTPEKGDKGARDTSSFKKPTAAKAPAAAAKAPAPAAAAAKAPAATAKAPAAAAEAGNSRGSRAPAPAGSRQAEAGNSRGSRPAAVKPAAPAAPAGARASTEQKSEDSDADDTRLSFAERRKRAEMRAKKGSPTDTRSANERIKNALGLKKGGDIRGYASGGSVSASRRGDGIAQRGKTRGKMC